MLFNQVGYYYEFLLEIIIRFRLCFVIHNEHQNQNNVEIWLRLAWCKQKLADGACPITQLYRSTTHAPRSPTTWLGRYKHLIRFVSGFVGPPAPRTCPGLGCFRKL